VLADWTDITGWPSKSLDWSTIDFHTPVTNWAGLDPAARLAAQTLYQMTGGVPIGRERSNVAKS
jgi:hypothetical protein